MGFDDKSVHQIDKQSATVIIDIGVGEVEAHEQLVEDDGQVGTNGLQHLGGEFAEKD